MIALGLATEAHALLLHAAAEDPHAAETPELGGLTAVAAVLALAWANSPWGAAYTALGAVRIGPGALHLDLTLAQWASDGLLAIFFFVAGLELKREFVAGDLREARRAALPVAAAVGGMIVPAVLFVLVNLGGEPGDLRGWAIPTATDIAFALAVLALVGSRTLLHYVFGHAFEEQTAIQAISAGAVERELDSLPDFWTGLDVVIDGLRSRVGAAVRA